jgi:hypothetical protein
LSPAPPAHPCSHRCASACSAHYPSAVRLGCGGSRVTAEPAWTSGPSTRGTIIRSAASLNRARALPRCDWAARSIGCLPGPAPREPAGRRHGARGRQRHPGQPDGRQVLLGAPSAAPDGRAEEGGVTAIDWGPDPAGTPFATRRHPARRRQAACGSSSAAQACWSAWRERSTAPRSGGSNFSPYRATALHAGGHRQQLHGHDHRGPSF